MSAYLVVEHIITDPAKFEEYRSRVAPMIARHGGRYLTKGGSHTFPEAATGSPSAWSSSNFQTCKRSTTGTAQPSISL